MPVRVRHSALNFEDRIAKLREIHVFPEKLLCYSTLDPCYAQQVVDKTSETVDILLYNLIILAALIEAETIDIVLRQHAYEALDRCHRGSELMGRDGDEF